MAKEQKLMGYGIRPLWGVNVGLSRTGKKEVLVKRVVDFKTNSPILQKSYSEAKNVNEVQVKTGIFKDIPPSEAPWMAESSQETKTLFLINQLEKRKA